MTVDVSSLSVEKALQMALKSEIETEETYKKLKSMVNNFILKDKLKFLASEEKKHQKILANLYQKMFKGNEPSTAEKSIFPRLSIVLEEEKSSVVDLLELAMEAEKVSEEFYDDLAEEVDERGVQEILQYLTSMEHAHYSLLKGEYDLCIRDEAYYERDDFQYDMVHIGP
ncbi:ferritin family protein [bacterium]|nr:ferritin family protein [bacterium]